MDPTLSQTNPVHSPITSSRSTLITSSNPCQRLPSYLHPSGFLRDTLYAFLISPISSKTNEHTHTLNMEAIEIRVKINISHTKATVVSILQAFSHWLSQNTTFKTWFISPVNSNHSNIPIINMLFWVLGTECKRYEHITLGKSNHIT